MPPTEPRPGERTDAELLAALVADLDEWRSHEELCRTVAIGCKEHGRASAHAHAMSYLESLPAVREARERTGRPVA